MGGLNPAAAVNIMLLILARVIVVVNCKNSSSKKKNTAHDKINHTTDLDNKNDRSNTKTRGSGANAVPLRLNVAPRRVPGSSLAGSLGSKSTATAVLVSGLSQSDLLHLVWDIVLVLLPLACMQKYLGALPYYSQMGVGIRQGPPSKQKRSLPGIYGAVPLWAYGI